MRAVVRATTGLVNLSVAGAAAVGAAALQSWPILAAGAATYTALVAWDLVRNPGRAAAREGTEAPRLRAPRAYGDAQTRAAVQAIANAKGELDRAMGETPAEVQANLAASLVSVDALLERAAGLAERCEDLSRYLATKDPRVVHQDVESLRQRVAQTADPEARAQYGSALAARQEHLRSLEELRNARERTLASLLSIASSLEGLPAKVVHMRALDAAAMDQLGGDVQGELERMNDDMKAFEETLRTLGEGSR